MGRVKTNEQRSLKRMQKKELQYHLVRAAGDNEKFKLTVSALDKVFQNQHSRFKHV